MKKSILTLFIATTIPAGLHAANVIATWNGGNSGTYSWENTSNWSSSTPAFHYPYNDGTDLYFGQINDSTGARVIETSGSLTMRGFSISQTSATGSTTLKLGGNFTATGVVDSIFPVSGFTNTTGDASRLSIDLNGHTLRVDLTTARSNLNSASNYTVRSSVSGGMLSFMTMTTSATNVQIQDGATIKLTGGGQNSNHASVSWSDQSTLIYAPTAANGLGSTGVINLGNFIVGDSSSATATAATLRNNAFRVRGDFSVATHSGGGTSSFAFDTTSRAIYVGGNFTDTGTTGGYNGGTIYFNGSAAEGSVLINRTGLNTNFQVGESGTVAGSIKLGGNLTTSGTFTVLSNSRLNVDTRTLTAGAVSINDGATLSYTVGDELGTIASTGDLLLNSFKLELALGDIEWVDGTDLVLFSYEGTFAGTPTLASFSSEDLTFGSLVFDDVNKRIYLSNVAVVPEPTTWGLIGAGALLLALRRSKRRG